MTLRYKREGRDIFAQSDLGDQWHWLRVATNEDYEAMPEAKVMFKCWFCDEMIEPVVRYYGPNVLARGKYVCVHRGACRERQSKLPFNPDCVNYDSS